MKIIGLSVIAIFMSFDVFSQTDVQIGNNYKFWLQRKNGHADAWILHNAKYNAGDDQLKWQTSHSSFGHRGIRFNYSTGGGIFFYAANSSTTSGEIFYPTARMFISNTGKVGIGTTSPDHWLELDVNQNAKTRLAVINKSTGSSQESSFSAVSDVTGFDILNYGSGRTGTLSGVNRSRSVYLRTHTGLPADRLMIGTGSDAPIHFFTDDEVKMSVSKDGNIGIGTTTPDAKLTVKGDIHAEEINVDLNIPGPDYVFEEDYDLLSLKETEEYIEEHKHLPEVPSAKKMEAEGIDLVKMNMLLLKKVEELTLHVIDLQQQINHLKD